jgi:hypothetical protein
MNSLSGYSARIWHAVRLPINDTFYNQGLDRVYLYICFPSQNRAGKPCVVAMLRCDYAVLRFRDTGLHRPKSRTFLSEARRHDRLPFNILSRGPTASRCHDNPHSFEEKTVIE